MGRNANVGVLQVVGNGLLTPVKCLIGKLQRPRFPEQQRRIQLSHLTDVIPQQGDPLQLAQILAAVHPEIQRRKGSSSEYGTLQQ